MSPPEQKPRPAPVRTTTRTERSSAARRSACTSARHISGLRALSFSGRFIRRVTTAPARSSSTNELATCCVAPMDSLIPKRPDALVLQSLQQSGQLLKVSLFDAGAGTPILSACRGQYENSSAVEQFLLKAKLARAPRKLFVDHFPIEGDHARTHVFQFLRQQHSALGKLLPLDFVSSASGPLYQVRHADAQLEHAPVILVSEGLWDHARLIHHRPELVVAPGIVMPHARGAVSRIGAYQDHLHPFAQVVG